VAQSDLETARLILKPVSRRDSAALHRLHSDPQIVRVLWRNRRPTTAESDARLAAYMKDWRDLGLGFWMVYKKSEDGIFLVGRAGLRPFAGTDAIEFGHCYAGAASGRGLAVEAGLRIFEHAFVALELPLLVGVIAPDNAPAIRVAAKLGQRFVGLRRHHGRLYRFYETTRDEYLDVAGGPPNEVEAGHKAASGR
jgi:RimJ/RimL family protein N-acetyltransferase